MIIVMSPSDQDIITAARNRAYNFPADFGKVYIAGKDKIPMLGEGEALYFTGHAVRNGSSGNAEIGDESGAFGMDGLELWDNFKELMPSMWQGDVYVDACESADFDFDMFSLIETFKSQSGVGFANTEVYGRTGSPGTTDPIPLPTADVWESAE